MIPVTLIKTVVQFGSQMGAGIITTSAVNAVVNTETLKTIPRISVKIASFGIAAAVGASASKATEALIDEVVDGVEQVKAQLKKPTE